MTPFIIILLLLLCITMSLRHMSDSPLYVDQVLAVMTRGCIKFGSRGRRNLESEVVLYNDNDNVNVSWVKFN
jgi:hypothetical protein